jgi:ATP-dependent NAD(P)H-hydrate dehydratase
MLASSLLVSIRPVSSLIPFIPSLIGLSNNRKGQHGRCAVVGGSEEYTGAPYYAAISCLKTGADLSFVLCSRAAATPIKAYSPELIVHPIFKDAVLPNERNIRSEIEAAIAVLDRADSVVFGPGLGRDSTTLKVVRELVSWTAAHHIPTVLDGDALWMLAQVG